MAICTCPCAIFRVDGPIHDDAVFALPCSVRLHVQCSVSLSLRGRAGMNWLRNRQEGKDRGSSLDAIARLHLDRGVAIEQNIHARTKLDESDPLAAGYVISHFKIENDAPRNQAGDLLEYHGTAFAFHGDDVLLVLLRRIRLHGIEELAALITHVADHACNRRAVHVNIEDAKKDADPVPRSSARSHQRYIGHFAVPGGNDGPRERGNRALGITEKPQKESSQQQQRNGVRPSCQPRDEDRSKQAPRTVEVAVTHHRNSVESIIWRKLLGRWSLVGRSSFALPRKQQFQC